MVKNIHHAYLVTGGDEASRREWPAALGQKLGIQPADILTIGNGEAIKIEEIRRLKSWIKLKPYSSPCKIAIIYGGELLTPPAANALLKTLEEPPARSILILTAVSRQGLLPTIVSRCHFIRVTNLQSPTTSHQLPDLINMTLPERFRLAADLAENPRVDEILAGWVRELHQRLLAEPPVSKIIRNIEGSRRLLATTNVNSRLLLENLFLRI